MAWVTPPGQQKLVTLLEFVTGLVACAEVLAQAELVIAFAWVDKRPWELKLDGEQKWVHFIATQATPWKRYCSFDKMIVLVSVRLVKQDHCNTQCRDMEEAGLDVASTFSAHTFAVSTFTYRNHHLRAVYAYLAANYKATPHSQLHFQPSCQTNAVSICPS